MLEGMIFPDTDSWIDILHVSHLISSQVLVNRVIDYLRDNSYLLLNSVEREEGLEEEPGNSEELAVTQLRRLYPDILNEVLSSRQLVQVAIPSNILLDHVEPNRPGSRQSKTNETSSTAAWTPLLSLGVALIALYLYAQVSTIIVLGPFVPIINTIALVIFFYVGYRQVFK